jgi:hypothetical protein
MIIPVIAPAQLELYGKYSRNGSVEPIINFNGSKPINKKFSLTFFALVRKTWSQALIGISYSASKVVTISAGAGIEHGKSAPRYSASVFIKGNHNTLLVLGELGNGKNNFLYKVNAFHQLNEHVIFGATSWRYHGTGPNLRYLFLKLHSTVWLMPAYDFEIEHATLMVGISLKM